MITTITISFDHAGLTADQSQSVSMVTPHLLQSGGVMARDAQDALLKVLCHAVVTVDHAKGWVAGWNIPGYLPDDEPQNFDEYGHASDYLIEELDRAAEQCDDPGIIAQFERASAAFRHQSGPGWFVVGNFVWWIAREQ